MMELVQVQMIGVLKVLSFTFDNYGTATRYIKQLGFFGSRSVGETDKSGFPYIAQGGGRIHDNCSLFFGEGNDLGIKHVSSTSTNHITGAVTFDDAITLSSEVGASTETTALMLNSSNLVSKRALGSNAFSDAVKILQTIRYLYAE